MALLILIYIVAGILVYGFTFALWQRHFPVLAEEHYYLDMLFSFVLGLGGFMSLAALALAALGGIPAFRYGVKFY